MTINEALIDKRIQQAARWYGSAEMSLKLTAIAAARVVGKYDGTTAEIAKQIRRSTTTVENLAHAKWLYDLYCNSYYGSDVDFRLVRKLWRVLPISHWWLAYDVIEPASFDSLWYLNNAYAHGWSGRRMLAEFRADYEAQHGAPPPVPFERKWQNFKAAITNVLADFDELTKRLTAEQLMALRVVVEAFGSDEQK